MKILLSMAVLFLALPALSLAAAPLVAVDVGHGIQDGGAISARGRHEFEFNREFAGRLADTLRQHDLGVREVNFDGRIASLPARPEAAAGSDFFISIHHDSIGEAWLLPWEWEGQPQTHTEVKRGYGIFVSAQNPDLATIVRVSLPICATNKHAPTETLNAAFASIAYKETCEMFNAFCHAYCSVFLAVAVLQSMAMQALFLCKLSINRISIHSAMSKLAFPVLASKPRCP